jgi:hypothetical protein
MMRLILTIGKILKELWKTWFTYSKDDRFGNVAKLLGWIIIPGMWGRPPVCRFWLALQAG